MYTKDKFQSEIESSHATPFLKWAGGKRTQASYIKSFFPEKFERYFEPFVGGGAVLFSMSPSIQCTVADIEDELINAYRVVRDAPVQLMEKLLELKNYRSEEFYYQLRKESPNCSIEAAARTIFLNKNCYNGLYRKNKRGEFNTPYDNNKKSCPSLFEKDSLLACSSRLKSMTLICSDFETVIKTACAGDVVYCDPPYEPVSKTSSFNHYSGKAFTREEQERLRDTCISVAKRGVFIAISNSDTPFIRGLYSDFRINEISSNRNINSKAEKRGPINELLITMY